MHQGHLSLIAMWIINTPDLQHSFVNVDVFAINTELEVSCFWTVELFPQSLCNRQEVILL